MGRSAVMARQIRLAVVGSGDVARRRYLPMLASLADRVDVVACCDTSAEALEGTTTIARATWPKVKGFRDLAECLRAGGLDAAVDLTPAPAHAAVNQQCLDAGLAVYSEKPLAGTLRDADRLI